MSLPPASLRFVAAAEALGLSVDVQEYPAGTKTSADAATAVGCEVSAIAKSLIFMADDKPVVAILSGDTRLDTKKLAMAMGATKVRRAELDEAKNATGFAAGGTPAFGYPSPIAVFIDPQLRRHDEVWSAAGTPTTVYRIPLTDLIVASGAVEVDLAYG
ncbi:MAG: YbaK/EbsC family protein [Acidimicrobiales bacterium]